ncbi:threonine/serine ThrE exporter family protein [Mumia sp. Pv 4-285]|uniref:threonine/serine ThrE exporter family protein n=1 Tax=Mumia qirimensis TaxID=3234852 RepID=UPI00351D9FE7
MSAPDPRDIYSTLDLALRIGDLMLSSGAGAADVAATMLAVTHACGLQRIDADVTFTELSLQHQPNLEEPASILIRRVRRRPADYAELIEVNRLVQDLIDGMATRDGARERIAAIDSADHPRARWLITVGWGAVGGSLAVTLGGGLVVSGLAFVAACGIDLVGRATRSRVPLFYQQTAGGLLATLVAVGAAATQIDADPSLIVTASIIILLAGIGLMGAMADALTGYPLTANARLLDALLATVGVIAGVAAGLTVAELAGADMGHVEPGATGLAQGSVMTIGAGLAAAAYGLACYAPLRASTAAACVAVCGQAIFLAVDGFSLGQTWAAATAAIVIGTISHGIAGRVRVPPLVLIVPAIVPLLPGVSIYRGLALLAEGEDGVLDLAAAGATAIALAAGVILGQYLAQPIRREGSRLESRLAGPRLAGPLLKRVGRRGRPPIGPNDA